MGVRRVVAWAMALVAVGGLATITAPTETAEAAAPRTAVGPGGTGILHVTPDGRFASVIANTGTAWGRLDMTTGALVTYPVSRGFLTANGAVVIGQRGSQIVRRIIATGQEQVWTPQLPLGFELSEVTGVSGDGRYVGLWASSGMVADVAVFVFDTTNASIKRVDTFTSPSLGGSQGWNGSYRLMPSSNGAAWAFEFMDGPVGCNACVDVWVATPSGYLELASPATDGGRSDTGNSRLLDISGNGRWVLFGSNATDLQAGAAGASGRLYVRDMTLNTTRVLPPIEGLQWGERAAISDDGQRVLMSVERTTWLSSNPLPVPALHDAMTGTTTLIVPNDAQIGDTLWTYSKVDLSASGTRLAYTMIGLGGPQSFRTDLARPTGEFVGIVPQRLLDTRTTGVRRPAGSVTEVLVGSSAGVPLNAKAASLTVTAVSPTGSGYATAYPCGSPRPNASTLNFGAATMANSTIAKLPATGKVCVYTSTSTHLLVDVAGYFPATSTFTSITPVRRYDSRSGTRPAAGQTVQVLVGGVSGIPSGARAASLNLTITGAQGPGYATAYPCGTARPGTSSINFGTGWTVANATITQLPANGRVCIYLSASAHVLVDVNGALPSASPYRSVTPARFYDSRPGSPRPAGSTTEVQITGRGGVPAGAKAVSLNVTTVGPHTAGYLTVFPCGARPGSSSANFAAGWTVANGALLRLPSNGRICLYSSATTDLLVDVNGYVP